MPNRAYNFRRLRSRAASDSSSIGGAPGELCRTDDEAQIVQLNVDLFDIEALGGADAAAKLAAMSPEDLIAFTCKTLFTNNPDWDEDRLEEYLAFLPDKTPQACNE
ncbi:protein of unknown function [Candidatus Promineifilum breve]|uniref:Uncharacterized protein n=1 Tax=Candidatus Promineifilum breve TaxID=1806508 RepID=A0A160T3X9_9CHLR|nr:hypothetical protein [Candidatus Promineifilum breve]CUS04524.2 protein of unknown function [Candidatus Promineifilum breve]